MWRYKVKMSITNAYDYTDKYVNLTTDEIGLKFLIVMENEIIKQTVEYIETKPVEEILKLYKRTLSDINKVKDGADPKTRKFSTDVLIFYAARWLLFETPIPIVRESVAKREEASLETCKCGLYQTCDICKMYQER